LALHLVSQTLERDRSIAEVDRASYLISSSK
jgi:hypothetical protein